MGLVGVERLATSVVAAGELRFGAATRRSPALTAAIDGILERLPVLPLEASAAAVYADIRVDLERAGTPIGVAALWIAAHARVGGMTLATANAAEFSRVRGLVVEDWTAA